MRVFCLVFAAGCSFTDGRLMGIVPIDADPMSDTSSVGMDTSDGSCMSFSTQLDTCGRTFEDDLVLSGTTTYSTDTHTLINNGSQIPVPFQTIMVGSSSVDFIFVSSLTMSGTFRASGTNPFGIVSTGSIIVGGSLGGSAGAQTACGSAGGAMAPGHFGGGAGGGGGAFQGDGGQGGNGDPNTGQAPGAAGGMHVTAFPGYPLGGCPGGRGGDGDGGGNGGGGEGGGGGGAIDLISATEVRVNSAGGNVTVGGGAGGGGVASNGGGGGGGAGGMILLEAPQITVAGVLAANGGGGGGGASGASGGNGTAGQASGSAAGGGTAGGSATAGGAGGAGANLDGVHPTATPNGGGGGGGGGVGFIAMRTAQPIVTGTISPALTPWQ